MPQGLGWVEIQSTNTGGANSQKAEKWDTAGTLPGGTETQGETI